jgi:hypothetical protein
MDGTYSTHGRDDKFTEQSGSENLENWISVLRIRTDTRLL